MVGSNVTITPDGWIECSLHVRTMSYPEWQMKKCWWCEPNLAPPGHSIHKLNYEEKEQLKAGKRISSTQASEKAHIKGKNKKQK